MSQIVSVTVRNNVTSKTVNVSSGTTVREIFNEAGMDYATGVVSIDGSSLPTGAIDKSLDDLGITSPRCFVMVTTKADNASDCEAEVVAANDTPVAKIQIIGNIAHIISSQKLEDIKLLKKYRPAVLSLMEGSGAEKHAVFSILTDGDKGGYVGQNGVMFSRVTTAEGNALVTLTAPEGTADMKAWVQEEVGVAILQLRKVEAGFAAALAEVKAEKAAVAAAITEA